MVKRLKNCDIYTLPDAVKNILNTYNYVFNPSLVVHKQTHYLAVRVYDSVSSSILAIVLVWTNENQIEQRNLSTYFKEKLDLVKVADPKLFIMNDKVYGSFNNSHAMEKPNTLVMFELDSTEIVNYYVCNYNERTRTEKNWTFYTSNNQLFVLYSLNPLTILKADTISENTMLFKKFHIDENQRHKNFSIGTPLLKLDKGYGFMAHKKYFRNKKLLYVGKPCIFLNEERPEIKVSKNMVIHSLKSLFGSKFKFNKNLISCTYFSGIHMDKDHLVLSYGINDVDWNLAKIKPKKLWE